LAKDGKVPGNGRWRQLQELDDLADEELAARQGQKRANAAFMCEGISDVEHFTHMVTTVFRHT